MNIIEWSNTSLTFGAKEKFLNHELFPESAILGEKTAWLLNHPVDGSIT